MFSMIVAMDRKGAIGRGNQLLWSLPVDMKHFREFTRGKTVVMGRQTALSIGKALPGRTNLVLSRSGQAPYEGQIALTSIPALLRWHVVNSVREIVVCGGGEIYRAMLPYISKLSVTLVDTVVEDADTFFMTPEEIFKDNDWMRTQEVTYAVDGYTTPVTISQYDRVITEMYACEALNDHPACTD